MSKAYLEFKDKTSSKFWQIEVKGSTVTVRYGKIGTDGQTTVKKFGSAAEASAHTAKVTAEKVTKGYKKSKSDGTRIKKAKLKPKKPRVSHAAQFQIWIKWGQSADDVDAEDLPKAFSEAKKLWKKRKRGEAGQIIAPFLKCLFIPTNVDGDLTELLKKPEYVEVADIQIDGVDFAHSNLPQFCASATLTLPAKEKITKGLIEQWENANDMLHSGVSFKWHIDGVDEDLDLYCENHQGLGMSLA